MKNLSDYIKEDGIAPSIGAETSASEFATPGNTSGMGNPITPDGDKPGSGDRFDTDEKTAKALKEKFRKRKKKEGTCTKCEEEKTD